MNVLIQQLSEKAKTSVPHGLTPDKWIEVYNEKFAELIVKECVNLCEDEWDGDADTLLASEAYHECAEAIKEHFGVEL